MREEGKEVSIARLCRWFGVARSSFYYQPEDPAPPLIDAALSELIRRVIEENPAYGVRRITAMVRRELNRRVNRKKVHRIIQINGWQIWQKPQGKRPRAQGWTSRATRPDERWAVDATHILWSGRLVSPDGDHRLLRPNDRRLAALEDRSGQGGGGSARRGAA